MCESNDGPEQEPVPSLLLPAGLTMSNKDDASGSFLFVNKSTTSRTLSRSKAKEKAEIFRHVQRARQKHDGQRQRHAARLDAPMEPLETCWALPDAKLGPSPREHDGRGRKENSTVEVAQSDGDDGRDHRQAATPRPSLARRDDAVTKWQDPAIQRLTGDGFDPFESFPKMVEFLPATDSCPHPAIKARSFLVDHIRGLDLTEFARRERLSQALVRPTVMFSHLMMAILESECTSEQLGGNLDRIFGTGALRHVRHEIQDLQDKCPWDLICLVNVFVIRAQAAGREDVANAHRGGLIAMIERSGGLRPFAATNEMAQAGANGLILGELLASAITGAPLHPVLGDVTAGGNFSRHTDDKAPVSPLNCVDGDFSELESSPHSRPETIHLLHAIWLLVQSVTQQSTNLKHRMTAACDSLRARKAILESFRIVSPQETKNYIYECCHLTAMLLLNATENHVPLHLCALNFPLVHRLEHLLKSRELPASWGAFKGVYLNVILVAFTTSLRTTSRAYFHKSLRGILGYYACGVWDGAYQPLATLKRFQDSCRSERDPPCP